MIPISYSTGAGNYPRTGHPRGPAPYAGPMGPASGARSLRGLKSSGKLAAPLVSRLARLLRPRQPATNGAISRGSHLPAGSPRVSQRRLCGVRPCDFGRLRFSAPVLSQAIRTGSTPGKRRPKGHQRPAKRARATPKGADAAVLILHSMQELISEIPASRARKRPVAPGLPA